MNRICVETRLEDEEADYSVSLECFGASCGYVSLAFSLAKPEFINQFQLGQKFRISLSPVGDEPPESRQLLDSTDIQPDANYDAGEPDPTED
ncbi:MAG: hypothetical protein SFY81_04810 [Verrucomicrobiota bacterium]|nr:hypothetical protein [Verrucomicrobiota bacterium]